MTEHPVDDAAGEAGAVPPVEADLVTAEANEADVLDQAHEVPIDEEEHRG